MPLSKLHAERAARRDSRRHAATASHDEWLIDEAVRESFPASDPSSPSQPGSILSVRYAAEDRAGFRLRRRGDMTPLWWMLAGCAIFAAGFLAGRRRR
jgi:hypothetical protein